MNNVKAVSLRNRQSIIALMSVLFAFLLLADGMVTYKHRSVMLEQEKIHVKHELELLGQLITEALTKGDYATVEIFVKKWGEASDDVISASVELANGFVLAQYQAETSKENLEKYTSKVSYGENKNALIKVSEDKSHFEGLILNLVLQLILASFLLVVALGIVIWRTLKSTAINPLEEEIARHEKTTKELRERALELTALNRELESFSYSVSHDLRTPLRAINGFSQALLDDYYEKFDEKGRDYLDRVRRGAERMSMLIDDLLKLSRVSRNKVERTEVDLGQMAKNIVQELQQNEPERKIKLSVEEELYVNGDLLLLELVMENLLNNAWKYTDKKELAMITVGKKLQAGVPVIYIKDNGIGFDMKFANKLFGAFQRLHRINEYEGTGIGLATAQRIIHLHGGSIWAEAEIDKGATFYFSLDSDKAPGPEKYTSN